MSLVLNKDNFDVEVKQYKGLVLVDFWATWCGPCKMLAPIIDEISKDKELNGKVKVCKVDVDDNRELAMAFGIRNIPTLKFFKNGEVVKTIVGFTEKEELIEIIGSLQ
ncbi:MAG: thioredoxin [Clostridia bacterium]|nr:thioredoxin [Clostridia bacterium]